MDQQIHQRCQQLEQDLSYADAMHERAELDKQELTLLTEHAEAATRVAREAIEELQSLQKLLHRNSASSGRRLYANPPPRAVQGEVVQAIVLKR
jgi:DNA-binding protein H-NS